jgi:hydrogenase maturation protein HypF
MTPSPHHHPERRRITVGGIVQGVGFRPFVYRLATDARLEGFILNSSSGVVIEVQGERETLDRFSADLALKAPPLARITRMDVQVIDCERGESGFRITDSLEGETMETLIPPDIATCPDCRSEILEPLDRRYRYPFTNCTNCGPRYTIVERIPYDRPLTSMKGFTMCRDCAEEYHDPANRRFHAQPNGCPVCGPSLSLVDGEGVPLPGEGDEVFRAALLLNEGRILALKGLGGFHLAVDGSNEWAVQRLRLRKGREEKPLAVMVRSVDDARKYCDVSPEEEEALSSAEAPIVLLKKRDSDAGTVAPSVAPGSDRLGVMLAYTPLHILLFQEGPGLLVMTSANFSEEPIVCDNEEAAARLQGIADVFLMHNRPIYLRCDDSVTIVFLGRLRQNRRSRGYVPAPVFLRQGGPVVLATGGELKNTLCLLKGTEALLSQHIGDMKNFEAYLHFQSVAGHLQRLFQAEAELLVHDLHPSYLTTRWAREQSRPSFGVQHHHAHLSSCLAENREEGPAIGVILDGTGYGTDGSIWGGEVLIGDASGASRFASFEPMPLPGGDAAVLNPRRTAAGYLYRSRCDLAGMPFLQHPQARQVIELLEKNSNCFETTSCGRLFDAVAAICNLRQTISYEGQAAIELMQIAGSVAKTPFRHDFMQRDGRLLMMISPLVQDIQAAVCNGMETGEISRRFHRTLVNLFSEIVRKAYLETGVRNVVLSGGVFQNQLLFETLTTELQREGFTLLTHSLVPSNDGGLSLGQAVIGREYLKGNCRGVV